ncbi:MAG: DUF2817 domain-containing protein [Leptospiraceae bacterium]|nr:DUF2817 domain-containing protein [Leptospiraceae bacterium]
MLWSACSSIGVDNADLAARSPRPDLLGYYKSGYYESRADFRSIAQKLRTRLPGLQCGVLKLVAAEVADLTTDWCYLPPAGTKGDLLVITSGLHGAEGPVGAAVQRYFMAEILPGLDRSRSGYLLIHAVNPWGFHHFRRVTGNNVDLNRNFDASGDNGLYHNKNQGYADLNEFLNPSEPASQTSYDYFFFTTRSIGKILWHGIPALRQAILQGQYQYPQGIYFGGQAPEQERALLGPLLQGKFAGYKAILAVDLHTGYGERGVLHLFPNDPVNEAVRSATAAIFAGYRIDWGSSDDFYTITGQFTDWMLTLTPRGSLYVPMVFEYGTLDSQTTAGSIESLKRSMLENQGYFHGYTSADQKQAIESDYREAFYPTSPHWRTQVMQDTIQVWQTVLPRLRTLGER